MLDHGTKSYRVAYNHLVAVDVDKSLRMSSLSIFSLTIACVEDWRGRSTEVAAIICCRDALLQVYAYM